VGPEPGELLITPDTTMLHAAATDSLRKGQATRNDPGEALWFKADGL
jgi:hypothetical protein